MQSNSPFKTILVGVDGTSEAQRAITVALSLAQSLHAKLILLGVIAPLSAETQAEGVGIAKAADARAQLEEQLRRTTEAARELKLEVTADLVEGDREEEIERKAAADSVDLIVVGHRNIGRLQRWLEGSTSEALVRSSRASVLVVHGGTADPAAG